MTNKFNIERLERLGMTAKVVNTGNVYTTYTDFAKASGYPDATVDYRNDDDADGKSMRTRFLRGKSVKILAKGRHGSIDDTLYVIENADGEHFLIGEDGIEIIESSNEKSYEELIADMTEIISQVHSRAFEMGYEQGKFDAAIRVAEVKPKETSQQKRDRIVEQAKKDVEDLKCKDSDFYDLGKYACAADFIVNKEKRTVVALLRGYYSNVVRAKGIAKCAPGDCFNVHIGKAIALRRALGLEVPTEYLNAPQPTEVRVGDVVKSRGGTVNKIDKLTESHMYYPDGYCNSIGLVERGYSKIIDDSREVSE